MIMGLPISIHLRNVADEQAAEAAARSAFADLRSADQIFSPYRDDSILSAFRRGELTLDEAPVEFRRVLRLAERARRLTDGAFDVAAGGILDPSGLVKGWAAERAARRLPGDHYLNAGGDIALRSDTRPWRIGIEHPAEPTALLAVLSISNGAVATSGTAHRGSHIVDPASGHPASGLRQATVVGPALGAADMWATAVVARGTRVLDRGDPLLATLVGRGYDALLVGDDGRCFTTAGFARHATDLPRSVVVPLS